MVCCGCRSRGIFPWNDSRTKTQSPSHTHTHSYTLTYRTNLHLVAGPFKLKVCPNQHKCGGRGEDQGAELFPLLELPPALPIRHECRLRGNQSPGIPLSGVSCGVQSASGGSHRLVSRSAFRGCSCVWTLGEAVDSIPELGGRPQSCHPVGESKEFVDLKLLEYDQIVVGCLWPRDRHWEEAGPCGGQLGSPPRQPRTPPNHPSVEGV